MRTAGAVVLVLAASGVARGETYYVSPSGGDGASGLQGSPWRTLQHAADSVGPGDTVLVEDGTYVGFLMETSGTSSSPITFMANGANVLVNSDPGTTYGDNIRIEASYVTIDGFRVESAADDGIGALPPSGQNESHGVVVRNCICANNGNRGIFSGYTEGILVEDNECYGSQAEHGIYVSNHSDNPVIRGNVCHDNSGNGIQTNGEANGGWGDDIISFAVIEENVVYHNNLKGLSIIATSDSIIRNNLIYENGPAAAGIHLASQAGFHSRNNVVVNNTVVEPNMSAVRIILACSGNELFNNILITGSTYCIALEDDFAVPGFASDCNVVVGDFYYPYTGHTLGEWQALGYDVQSFRATGNELFEDAAGDDYRLNPSSPAIDAGASSFSGSPAASTDIDGGARPEGPGYDIGCYEYGSTPGPSEPDPGCGSPGCGSPAGAGGWAMLLLCAVLSHVARARGGR